MSNILRLVLLILLILAFCVPQSISQILLNKELLDSLISKTVTNNVLLKSQGHSYPVFHSVIKLVQLKNCRYYINASSTRISVRADIPNNALIYLHNNKLIFMLLERISVDDNLQDKLIYPQSDFYKQILDSIEMPFRPINGLMISREKLIVYKIRRRIYNKKHFVITSQTFIPYKSAPKRFQPVIDFTDEVMSSSISLFYYDNRMRLKKDYYDDLKPIKPIKLRLLR